MFLSVTMTAAYALFDTLGVPGEIVVDHKGAELQVDAFRSRFRGDHDRSVFPEGFHQRAAHIRIAASGKAVVSGVAFPPASENAGAVGIVVAPVEQYDTAAIASGGKQLEQIALGSTRLGENDGAGFGPEFRSHGKGGFRRGEKGVSLGVSADHPCAQQHGAQTVYFFAYAFFVFLRVDGFSFDTPERGIFVGKYFHVVQQRCEPGGRSLFARTVFPVVIQNIFEARQHRTQRALNGEAA